MVLFAGTQPHAQRPSPFLRRPALIAPCAPSTQLSAVGFGKDLPAPVDAGGARGRGGGGRGSGRGGGGRGRGQPPPTAGKVREGENRLAKVLAAAGVASRRSCEDIIARGLVAVNGTIVTVPQTMVDLSKDKVWVEGKPIQTTQRKVYFMIHKPKGYVCSSVLQEGLAAKPLLDILQPWIDAWKVGKPRTAIPPRLFTVGRLDVQTTGLIIVTNDGLWAQQISHPNSGVSKEYVAKVDRVPTKAEIVKIQLGCDMDGVFVQPLYADRAGIDPTSRERLRIVVTDGRNREVRRLIEHAGLECVQLKRVRIGGLELPDKLGQGKYSEMTPAEVKRISDKGAQNNMLVAKHERIISSGQRGMLVREKKYFK